MQRTPASYVSTAELGFYSPARVAYPNAAFLAHTYTCIAPRPEVKGKEQALQCIGLYLLQPVGGHAQSYTYTHEEELMKMSTHIFTVHITEGKCCQMIHHVGIMLQ